MGPDAMILVVWMLSVKPTFSTLLFHFHQEALWFLFAFCLSLVIFRNNGLVSDVYFSSVVSNDITW